MMSRKRARLSDVSTATRDSDGVHAEAGSTSDEDAVRSTLTIEQARELANVEMQRAQTRIKAVLSRVATAAPDKQALRTTAAPAQAQAANSTAPLACSSCATLQSKLVELQKQAAIHREERRAWQQFKTWWLDSLSKHQRRKSTTLMTPSVGNDTPHKYSRRAIRQDPISHMVADLDVDARRIWEQAGVMSAVEKLDENTVESEPALTMYPAPITPGAPPLHSAREIPLHKSPAPQSSHKPVSPARKSTSPTATHNLVSPPSARGAAKPAPMIRTTHPRVRPSSTCAADAGGFVEDVPERNKHARRTMIAHDCPDCALFYSHFDSRLPSSTTATAAAERQACSRHRTTYQRATTPQGYWNIGFPTTQDAEEINAHARHQHHTRRQHH